MRSGAFAVLLGAVAATLAVARAADVTVHAADLSFGGGDGSLAAQAEVDGALATSSESSFKAQCWNGGKQYRTKRHLSDPRKYLCGGAEKWYTGEHAYVNRCGKWYRSSRSNQYYKRGRWVKEHVKPHPTNPTLVRRACRWVHAKRTAAVRLMYRAPTGVWFRSRRSREYYTGGTWGHKEVNKAHPTDPNLRLEAGRWVRKTNLPGQRNWTKRCGAWWRRKAGAGIKSFQYYYRGVWKLARGYLARRNDPRWVWSAQCKFVRAPVTAASKLYRIRGKTVYRRGALPSGGYWFRRAGSLSYYRGGAWRLASRHLLDPRWRRNDRTGRWRALSPKSRPQIKRYVYDAKTRTWWRSAKKRAYWSYGRWILTRAERKRRAAARAARARRERVDRNAPINLRGTVRTATNREFARFMRWFTRKVVARRKSFVPPAREELLRRMDGHPPRRRPRSPENPEPGLVSRRNLFNPEPPVGKRELLMRRLRETTVDSYRDTGAPEPFFADKGRSPDSKVKPVSDTVRYGHLSPWKNTHKLASFPVKSAAGGNAPPDIPKDA